MEWPDVALVSVVEMAGPKAVVHVLSICSAWRNILDNEDVWEALLESLCSGSLITLVKRPSSRANAHDCVAKGLARKRFVLAATRQVWFLGPNGTGGVEQLWKDPVAPALVHKVCCGRFHVVYLTLAGDAFAFGDGTYGCLGNGSLNSPANPTRICAGQVVEAPDLCVDRPPRSLAEARARGRLMKAAAAKTQHLQTEVDLRRNIMAVAAGGLHTALISRAGHVFMCGSNNQGQLGVVVPQEVQPTPACVALGWRATEIACGEGHTIVLGSGEFPPVLSWGQNRQGQVGIGVAPGDSLLQNQPRPVTPCFQNPVVVVSIHAGGLHTLAQTSDGRALAWGSNAYGQCGRRFAAAVASANSDVFTPMEVEGLHQRVVKLYAGSFHSLGILQDNTLVAWGCNKKGQLGVITESACNPEPLPIPTHGAPHAALASCGNEHTAVLLKDGSTVLTCGNPDGGRLGRDNGVDDLGEGRICSNLEPATLGLGFLGKVIVDVIAGWKHTILLTSHSGG